MDKFDFKDGYLELQQQPYIGTGSHDGFYVAHALYFVGGATYAEDQEYYILWPIVDAEAEDESDACNWDDYKIVKC